MHVMNYGKADPKGQPFFCFLRNLQNRRDKCELADNADTNKTETRPRSHL